uniref:NADH dehydrogenase subunit 4L n=1 Tax=Parachtes romandiolae TaxID=1110492 RepID=A0A516IMB6_9ARAC|nr:NADH dehydrogenase subunit 4L [Parachtes romandiolae]QDP17913.1 NADH dehydrogenase subunit 4L [Parachtes romandiolae]
MITTMIFISILSLCWWRNHLIMMMLSLEMMLLSILFLLMNTFNLNFAYNLLMLLLMMVTASSFGLSMLVTISRSHKSSLTQTFTSLIYSPLNSNLNTY